MASYIGCKLKIIADTGVYTGYLANVDTNGNRLTLEKAVAESSGKKLNGLIHFFRGDIIKWEALEEKKTVVTEEERGRLLLRRNRFAVPPHLYRRKCAEAQMRKNEFQSDSEVDSLGNDESSSNSDCTTNSSKPSQQDICNRILDGSQINIIVLEEMNSSFYAAIAEIHAQSSVGLAVEGINIGRNGNLSFIQFSTATHVFLFDIIALGDNAMQEGICDLLANENIVKITHDCRALSDMIFHRYRTKMINIFDTQVAHVLVQRWNYEGDIIKFVPKLHVLLLEHLSLTPDEVYIGQLREQKSKSEQTRWMRRPCSYPLFCAAVQNVVYLKELRRVLMEKMMRDVIVGTDIYLEQIRDSPSDKARVLLNELHTIPPEFITLRGIGAPSRQRPPRPTDYDELGFRNNAENAERQAIRFRQNGAWLRGDGTTYRPKVTVSSKEQLNFSGDAENIGHRSFDRSMEYNETEKNCNSKATYSRQPSTNTLPDRVNGSFDSPSPPPTRAPSSRKQDIRFVVAGSESRTTNNDKGTYEEENNEHYSTDCMESFNIIPEVSKKSSPSRETLPRGVVRSKSPNGNIKLAIGRGAFLADENDSASRPIQDSNVQYSTSFQDTISSEGQFEDVLGVDSSSYISAEFSSLTIPKVAPADRAMGRAKVLNKFGGM